MLVSSIFNDRTEPTRPLRCVPCEDCYFSKRASFSCQPCPEGFRSRVGADKCFPIRSCPPGTGTNRNGGRTCATCSDFGFNDGSSSFCEGCPDGFRGDKRAGSTRCVPCPAGTRHEFDSCKRCKPGENSFVTGATFCMPDNTDCASNFFRNAREACQRCT